LLIYAIICADTNCPHNKLGFHEKVAPFNNCCFYTFLLKGYSETISFSGNNVHLTRVFSAIKSQTGYVFFYDAAVLRESKSVTIDLKNASLEEALNQLPKDQLDVWAEI
jgi:hypothetical protein